VKNKAIRERLEEVSLAIASLKENTHEPEDPTQEDIGNTSTEAPLKDVKGTIQKLKNRIQDLIKRNAYTNLMYQGSTFDYEGVKPNQKDLDSLQIAHERVADIGMRINIPPANLDN